MYDRLVQHLDNNIILSNCQYGFRKNMSPKIAITQLTNQILQALSADKFTITVFLDLKKAFDTLDHDILLDKLQHYGIRNLCKNWFISYLCDRYQYTIVNNKMSKSARVKTGVPQGSTLGPLLFLLYINDIVKSSSMLKFILFADDTSVIHSGSDLVSLTRTVNTELDLVSTWLMANKLSLNIQKTYYIIFAGNKQFNDNFNVKICNHDIQRSDSVKYLGVYIDQKLKWNNHVNHIQSKLAKSLGILHKVKNLLTKDTLVTLYYTLFYPYLHYCNVVWGMAHKTTLNSLVLLQKRIIRTVACVGYYDHTASIFSTLKILKLDDIHALESLKFIYEQQNTQIFSLPRVSEIHDRNTRNRHLLRPVFPKLELHKRFVLYSGCLKWNELPDDIKQANNKFTFKINVKRHILQRY